MSNIINGKEIAEQVCNQLRQSIEQLQNKHSILPCLKVIIVGNNPASESYVRSKQKKATTIGIDAETIYLEESITEAALIQQIVQLNNDALVHGILVQLPLPSHIDENKIIHVISREKDVDGFHPENVGMLVASKDCPLKPCTPAGCLYLIKSALGSNLTGLDATIIGRSNIVGKPISILLLHENCTVTITHSRTKNIKEKTKNADIVIAAVGIPNFVTADFIKPGATIIDVGISKVDNKIVGDVNFEEVSPIAKHITPVPGGVGPMTIAFLMTNTVIAACIQNGIDYRTVIPFPV